MTFTILLTGFGPFPGAPFNPTALLVQELARRNGADNVRRVAHVFPASYAAVDRELPALIERERPDVLLMFGLAAQHSMLRVETRARNALARGLPDAEGYQPERDMIAPAGPPELTLPSPAQRLVSAACTAGVSAALSRDAGSYVCNYLCWRACEIAGVSAPRIVTFVHVPEVRDTRSSRPQIAQPPFTLDDLVRASEAIERAILAADRAQS